MLYQFAIRCQPWRQVCRVAWKHPKSSFTTLTKIIVKKQTGVHSTRNLRAMISSVSAAPSQVPGTETYLRVSSSPNIDYDSLKSRVTCTKFHDSKWGLVIYRCSAGNQSAWDRLLQALHTEVKEDLKYDSRQDMLESHDLHIIDDETLHGATSHQVRDHFQTWVPKNLENRLRSDAIDLQGDVGWVYASSTPRYKYCLFVDDMCLESMDHPGPDSPVVKLLCKDWTSPFPPHKRNYEVPAPFHDGATEYDEEDVGWMYMPLRGYMYQSYLLGKDDWDDLYVRPPYIDGNETEETFVGHWRQASSSEEA